MVAVSLCPTDGRGTWRVAYRCLGLAQYCPPQMTMPAKQVLLLLMLVSGQLVIHHRQRVYSRLVSVTEV
jgi:hypothetical protein